jgi:hypothetical protein
MTPELSSASELTIRPIGTYHGTGKPRGRPRKTLNLQQNRYCHRCPDNTVSGMSRALHTLKRTGWPVFKEHYRLVFVDIVPELRSGVRRLIGRVLLAGGSVRQASGTEICGLKTDTIAASEPPRHSAARGRVTAPRAKRLQPRLGMSSAASKMQIRRSPSNAPIGCPVPVSRDNFALG